MMIDHQDRNHPIERKQPTTRLSPIGAGVAWGLEEWSQGGAARGLATKCARTLSPTLERLERALEVYRTGRLVMLKTLPLTLRPRANASRSSSRLAGSHAAKVQRVAAFMVMGQWPELPEGSLTVVRMVRVAPRELDDDNLASAFKSVRDGITDAFGLASDRDPRVAWLPDWERSTTPRSSSVRIEVYREASS